MRTFKQLLVKMPEYYLIALVLLTSFPEMIGFMGLGMVTILILQIVYKNNISGTVIASLFMLLNLFMLVALLSEFREFTVFNAEAQQLLFVGLAIFLFNFLMAGVMLLKYMKSEENTQLIPASS